MMNLILWRHAEAEELKDDLKRRLTPYGQKQAKIMARWLEKKLPKNYTLLCSEAMRTQETAGFLKNSYQIEPYLNPSQTAVKILPCLLNQEEEKTIVCVGHQPWIGQLCAYLLSKQNQYWSVEKGAIWWFRLKIVSGTPYAKLKVMISPYILQK